MSSSSFSTSLFRTIVNSLIFSVILIFSFSFWLALFATYARFSIADSLKPLFPGSLVVKIAICDNQSSNSLKNRLLACPTWRSKKPSIRDPANPNKDEEKAVDIPLSGALKPFWMSINKAFPSFDKLLILKSIVFITPDTEEIVCKSPQKVPNNPRKTKRPIIYLKISLLSSSLDETPSKMVLKELADKDGLSVLVSDNTAATGARSIGFIFNTILAGIKLSFLFINLSHFDSLLNLNVWRNEKIIPNINVLIITPFSAVFPSNASFRGSKRKNIRIATTISKNNILKAYLFGFVILIPLLHFTLKH